MGGTVHIKEDAGIFDVMGDTTQDIQPSIPTEQWQSRGDGEVHEEAHRSSVVGKIIEFGRALQEPSTIPEYSIQEGWLLSSTEAVWNTVAGHATGTSSIIRTGVLMIVRWRVLKRQP